MQILLSMFSLLWLVISQIVLITAKTLAFLVSNKIGFIVAFAIVGTLIQPGLGTILGIIAGMVMAAHC